MDVSFFSSGRIIPPGKGSLARARWPAGRRIDWSRTNCRKYSYRKENFRQVQFLLYFRDFPDALALEVAGDITLVTCFSGMKGHEKNLPKTLPNHAGAVRVLEMIPVSLPENSVSARVMGATSQIKMSAEPLGQPALSSPNFLQRILIPR